MAERQSELNTGSGATPEQIRDDIRRTRADMDETVDAIGERLRPRHLLDDVLDLFRSSSGTSTSGSTSSSPGTRDAAHVAKDLGATAFQKMKNHPMPAALIGAGLAWLLFDESSSDGHGPHGRWRDGELREHSGSFVDARTGQPYDPSYGADYAASGGGDSGGDSGGPGMLGKAADSAKSIGRSVASAGSSVAGAASSVAGAASSAGQTVADYAGRAGSASSQYGRQARDMSGQAYDRARRGMSRGAEYSRQTFEQSLEQYPLAVVAAAFAGGMLSGLLVPTTRRENELMGEQSDQLKETVKTQMQDAKRMVVEKGKEVADAATEVADHAVGAVSDEAQKQGMAPDTLTEKVKNVARDVVGTAKESARREGLTDVAQKGKDVLERGKETIKDEVKQKKDRMKS